MIPPTKDRTSTSRLTPRTSDRMAPRSAYATAAFSLSSSSALEAFTDEFLYAVQTALQTFDRKGMQDPPSNHHAHETMRDPG